MKRCWFGLGVLVGILVLGLLFGAYFGRLCREAGDTLSQIPPEEIIHRVFRKWEENRMLASVLCDHGDLEEIEENFRILDPAADNYREACLRLAAKLHALARAQQLSWENVF